MHNGSASADNSALAITNFRCGLNHCCIIENTDEQDLQMRAPSACETQMRRLTIGAIVGGALESSKIDIVALTLHKRRRQATKIGGRAENSICDSARGVGTWQCRDALRGRFGIHFL